MSSMRDPQCGINLEKLEMLYDVEVLLLWELKELIRLVQVSECRLHLLMEAIKTTSP